MPSSQQLARDNQALTRKLTYANRRVKFAWGKYFGEMRDSNSRAVQQVEQMTLLPEHIKAELKELIDEARRACECPICMDIIQTASMEITNCGHKYHKECLAQVQDNKCPTCRRKLKYN